jgi:hypothetical protein
MLEFSCDRGNDFLIVFMRLEGALNENISEDFGEVGSESEAVLAISSLVH